MTLVNKKLIKLNDRGVRNVSTFGSVKGGSMVFIKKVTASSDDTISFVDGTSDVVLDDTYKEYLFTFNNIHPATNAAEFQFNVSIDSGSNYNVAKTTTWFQAYHDEADTGAALGYVTSRDLAQGTGVQVLTHNVGSDNDQCTDGFLRLFNPSSTVFVKHFIAQGCVAEASDYMEANYCAGYANTTSAVDAIQFSMSSGNIDAGDICLYGIN